MGRNYEEWVEATGERGLQLDLRRICPGVEGLPQDGEPPSQDTDSRGRGRWVPCCRAVVLLVTLEQRISSGWELAGNADAGALPQTHPIRDCTLGFTGPPGGSGAQRSLRTGGLAETGMDRQVGKDKVTFNSPSEPETLRCRRMLISPSPLPFSFRGHGHTVLAEAARADGRPVVSAYSPLRSWEKAGQTPVAARGPIRAGRGLGDLTSEQIWPREGKSHPRSHIRVIQAGPSRLSPHHCAAMFAALGGWASSKTTGGNFCFHSTSLAQLAHGCLSIPGSSILAECFKVKAGAGDNKVLPQAPAGPLSSVPAHSGFCPEGRLSCRGSTSSRSITSG